MNKKRAMIAASVAGLLAAVSVVGATAAQAADDKVPCYGINKCKGAGDCGGKAGNSCAGKNACKGAGFIKLSKDDCLRINGGSLIPAGS